MFLYVIHFGRYAFPYYDKQRIRKLGTMDAMDIMGIHTTCPTHYNP